MTIEHKPSFDPAHWKAAALRLAPALDWARRSWKWLAGALLAAIVFGAFTDDVMKWWYKPSKKKSGGGISGFLRSLNEPDGPPKWKSATETALPMLWFLCGGVALFGLALHVRPAAEAAESLAADARRKADEALQQNRLPDARAQYQEYMRWTLRDRDLIRTKVARLNDQIAQDAIGASRVNAPSAPVDRTLVTSAGATAVGALPTSPDGTVVMQAQSNRIGPQGRYELRKMLGKGGMGEVYEAWDGDLERVIALKKLPPHFAADAQFLTRFQHEAKALARVSHPFIVQVFDIIRDPSGVYLALEFVSGGDLQGLIQREGKLNPARTLELARKMAEGLAFAHDKGIVHRDIKPLNILLTEDGQPKLTDFGLAKMESATQLTMDGAILGSPHYMSPEQVNGKPADARSDIYAFGIMLFVMLAGETPYQGDTGQVLAQHLTQRVRSLPDVLPALDAIVQRCTEREADARYADGRELLAALNGVSGAQS